MEIIKFVNKSEHDTILKVIASLNAVNCVESFNNYLNSNRNNMTSQYEKEYNNRLNNDINRFGREILTNHFKSLTEERRLEILVETHMDSPYSFCNAYDNWEVNWFIETYINDPVDRVKAIKKYMVECLDWVEAKYAETNKEKELKVLSDKLANAEKQLAHYQQQIDDLASKREEIEAYRKSRA